MMRDFVYDLLHNPAHTNNAALRSIIPGTRIVSSGAADDLKPPFLVIRAGLELRPMPGVWQSPFVFHVHDKPGSYVQIDSVLSEVDSIMMSCAPVWWQSSWVMSVTDNGVSEDLYDDHYNTATRNAAYTITVRR